MQATTFTTLTVAVALLATLGAAQDYYDEPVPRRPAPRPAPASYSAPSSSGPKPTPVPILKQINRHNEDGSYTYGYEGADGTFKIETKLPTGEVKGKYGYLDDVGKVRVVEYGANRYGFQPAGEGITVAPPTLVDETTNKDGTLNPEYIPEYSQPEPQQPRLLPRPRPQPQPQPAQDFDYQSAPRYAPAPQPISRPAPVPPRAQVPGAAPLEISYAPAPRPAPRPAPAFRPAPAPVQEDISYAEPAPAPRPVPAFRPAPQPSFAPAPRPAPQPSFAPAPRPAPQPSFAPAPQGAPRPQPGRGGVLDQLARDYALPQDSAAPLHDISFGYY